MEKALKTLLNALKDGKLDSFVCESSLSSMEKVEHLPSKYRYKVSYDNNDFVLSIIVHSKGYSNVNEKQIKKSYSDIMEKFEPKHNAANHEFVKAKDFQLWLEWLTDSLNLVSITVHSNNKTVRATAMRTICRMYRTLANCSEPRMSWDSHFGKPGSVVHIKAIELLAKIQQQFLRNINQ